MARRRAPEHAAVFSGVAVQPAVRNRRCCSEIAAVAKAAGAPLAVDNAFFTPVMQQPLAHGADIVVHTATKYLDGQGRCVGGALVTDDQKIHDELFNMLRTTGPCMSPFNAWVFAKGLETLALRMQRHCANAMRHRRTFECAFGGAESALPGPAVAPAAVNLRKPATRGFGGVVAFEVRGGREAAWRVIDRTRLISVTANLGDAKTTITHPATTTHARITAEERARAGITDNLVRVAAGLEHADDLIADLERGLAEI